MDQPKNIDTQRTLSSLQDIIEGNFHISLKRLALYLIVLLLAVGCTPEEGEKINAFAENPTPEATQDLFKCTFLTQELIFSGTSHGNLIDGITTGLMKDTPLSFDTVFFNPSGITIPIHAGRTTPENILESFKKAGIEVSTHIDTSLYESPFLKDEIPNGELITYITNNGPLCIQILSVQFIPNSKGDMVAVEIFPIPFGLQRWFFSDPDLVVQGPTPFINSAEKYREEHPPTPIGGRV